MVFQGNTAQETSLHSAAPISAERDVKQEDITGPPESGVMSGGKASQVIYLHTGHHSPPRGWTKGQGVRECPQGHPPWPCQDPGYS